MFRENAQKKAVELIQEKDAVALEWATGLGKSYAAIKMIEQQGGKWHIIVPRIPLINNWKQEFIKFNKDHLLENCYIYCYPSIKKYTEQPANVILDEGHHVTDNNVSLIQEVLGDNKLIVLSATISDEKKVLLETIRSIYYYTITLEEAINNGVLPTPEIVFVERNMDTRDKERYVYTFKKGKPTSVNVVSHGGHYNLMRGNPNYEIHVKCSEYQYYKILDDQVEYWRKRYYASNAAWMKSKWLQTATKRKRFIAKTKTDLLKYLVELEEDKRTIIFAGSIEQCNEIGGRDVFHSKATENKLQQFNDGLIDHLFVVKAVDEGQNLTNIESSIIGQADGKTLSFIQRLGRVLRGLNPKLWICINKNTQDEKYLSNIIEELGNISYTKISENDLRDNDPPIGNPISI